jgi:hypothetical protein
MTGTTKRKIDKVLGHDPWEIEVAFWIEQGIVDRDIARAVTIRRYMEFNDLRPLRAALAKATRIDDKTVALDAYALVNLIELIDQGRLVVKPLRGGKPKDPAKWARDFIGALRFEKRIAKKSESDAAFKQTANELCMTEVALREAVTRWRKANAA